MSRHMEIEFKNQLTKEEMNQFLKHFNIPPSSFYTQENIYFDTPQLNLQQLKKALRVRIKKDTYTFTLKEESDYGNPETNQRLDPHEAESLLSRGIFPKGIVKERLTEIGIHGPIQVVTRITTKRATCPYQGQTLFFDISTYEGVTDYEFELETDRYEDGKVVFYEILSTLNIPKRPTKHKITRALEQKAKRQQHD